MARTFHDYPDRIDLDRPAISRRRQERTEATRRRLAEPTAAAAQRARARGPAVSAPLACAMDGCTAAVARICDRGFVYCDAHGIMRQRHGRCRKLAPRETAALRRGETIRYERAGRRP